MFHVYVIVLICCCKHTCSVNRCKLQIRNQQCFIQRAAMFVVICFHVVQELIIPYSSSSDNMLFFHENRFIYLYHFIIRQLQHIKQQVNVPGNITWVWFDAGVVQLFNTANTMLCAHDRWAPAQVRLLCLWFHTV